MPGITMQCVMNPEKNSNCLKCCYSCLHYKIDGSFTSKIAYFLIMRFETNCSLCWSSVARLYYRQVKKNNAVLAICKQWTTPADASPSVVAVSSYQISLLSYQILFSYYVMVIEEILFSVYDLC